MKKTSNPLSIIQGNTALHLICCSYIKGLIFQDFACFHTLDFKTDYWRASVTVTICTYYTDVKSSFQNRHLYSFKTAHIIGGSWIAENEENNSREWAVAEGGSISHHSNRNTTSAEWEVAPRFGCGKPCSSACQGGQKFHMILEFS